jgi:AraC-like DNA-binding protein
MQEAAMALNRFPIVDTHDEEVMRQIMLTRYGAKRFERSSKSSPFLGRSATADLGSASLVYCAYGVPALAEFPEADFIRLQFAFSGVARTTTSGKPIEVSTKQSCVTSADRPCRIEFGAGYQQILLRVEPVAMERKLTALLGAKPRGRLEFAPTIGADDLQTGRLKNLIRFVAGELTTSSVQHPHFLLREFEETLMVAFLRAVPNSFSDILQRQPSEGANTHVRLVEEYIDAHWNLPLSVERLADVTGIGARTIFATFKRHRGYTPMAYLKMVRLRKAKELLRVPNELLTVAEVAFTCGFSNLGHFANDYREAFGELPSLTLARARQLR